MVQNPDIVELVPRSENELQILGKKEGFTTITLWDTQNKTYSVDVLVVKDGRELAMRLRQAFPDSALKVQPFNNTVMITGPVGDPQDVTHIQAIAKDYYPEVINRTHNNNVQQVLLHVKIMEVSRTKLRRLGVDWAYLNTNVPVQSVAGLLAATGVTTTLATSGAETFKFGLVANGNPFFAVIEALRQNNLAKVLAEPNLVTVSGRPAFFNSGGEFPILVPQSLGTVSIEYKKFGTQVDFLPIVMRDGHIRLEVRPRVSEVDPARSVTIGGMTVPGLRTREVDTGVDLRAGQTLAIAGLVQTRLESETRGLPWLMDLPYIGVPFRRVESEENEIELLIMVTPELVQGMEQCEVPPGGPGLATQVPSDCELGFHGYIEVPKCCGPDGGVLEPGLMGTPGVPVEGEVIPAPSGNAPKGAPAPPAGGPGPGGASKPPPPPPSATMRTRPVPTPTTSSRATAQSNRQYSYIPSTPNRGGAATASSGTPGLIGPQGYDVRN
jgi:pilus assembly protein CpaC